MTEQPTNFKVPSPVMVPVELHKRLLALNSEINANQEMMMRFQAMYQSRLAEQRDKVRQCWADIFKATGVDLVNISWEPHETLPQIVPVGMNFARPGEMPGKLNG